MFSKSDFFSTPPNSLAAKPFAVLGIVALHSHGSAVLAAAFVFPELKPSLLQSLHDTFLCHVVICGVMPLDTSRIVGLKPGY